MALFCTGCFVWCVPAQVNDVSQGPTQRAQRIQCETDPHTGGVSEQGASDATRIGLFLLNLTETPYVW